MKLRNFLTLRTALAAAAVWLVLSGAALLYFGSVRTVTVWLDGVQQHVATRSLTVNGVLRDAGYTPSSDDLVTPPSGAWLRPGQGIRVDRARLVQIYTSGKGPSQGYISSARLPANLLQEAGIRLYPGDRLYYNGAVVKFDQPLPPASSYLLQYSPSSQVALRTSDGYNRLISSAAPSVLGRLWDAGVRVSSADRLDWDDTATSPLAVDLASARPITIQVGGQQIQGISAAATVGEALARAGIALQGLDYASPVEDQPVPPDGLIRVVRVHEVVELNQTAIPYDSEIVENPELELDQREVMQPGQYGVQVSRVRVRYEDGQEVSRNTESEWTAAQPVNEKVGYGSRIVIRTLDTPAGPVEYWRAVTGYATSYSPCGLGDPSTTKCYYGTSLGLPVKRGVIGVTKYWYRILAGQNVYVPGYGPGVIADIGAGIPGERWIDLGFTDDELELWHQYVTLYFLTPVPANVPLTLP